MIGEIIHCQVIKIENELESAKQISQVEKKNHVTVFHSKSETPLSNLDGYTAQAQARWFYV